MSGACPQISRFCPEVVHRPELADERAICDFPTSVPASEDRDTPTVITANRRRICYVCTRTGTRDTTMRRCRGRRAPTRRLAHSTYGARYPLGLAFPSVPHKGPLSLRGRYDCREELDGRAVARNGDGLQLHLEAVITARVTKIRKVTRVSNSTPLRPSSRKRACATAGRPWSVSARQPLLAC